MATFKTEVQNKKADATYSVRLRITHKGKIRRIPTGIFVPANDVTAGLKIKNNYILDQCEYR